jgi:hypothetical protein
MKISMPGYTQRIIDDYLPSGTQPSKTPSSIIGADVLPAPNDLLDKQHHTLFMRIVGSLLYLAISVRPDILYSVHALTQHMKAPSVTHLQAAYRVLRYLSGTTNFSLTFYAGHDVELQAYADAAYANNVDYKSQHGICFRLGTKSACFYSITKKQNLIALSSTESEYIALAECVREVIWFRSMFDELNLPISTPTPIYQDNRSCIKIAQDPSVADRTKHIAIRHHFVKERIALGNIVLVYTPTAHMVADILTKPLSFAFFKPLLSQILGEGDENKA